MIIVRRSSSNVNKLQTILSLSTSSSPMTMASSPSASSNSNSTGIGSNTTSSDCGGGQGQSFDWAYVFSPDNKAKTIQLLTMDKENFAFQKNTSEEATLRKAAVLIPLCNDVNGKPALLYNLRSLSMNKHRGEISFPGGSLDPEDKGCEIAAALRETQEELGIDPSSIDIWTSLRIFPTIQTDLVVIPVLGLIKGTLDPASLKINPDEVDHAFTISLEHLCDPNNWEISRRNFKGQFFDTPMWKVNGEQIHLWGLTAYISHLVLLSILPKNVYGRKLSYLQLQLKKLKGGKPKL